MGIISISELKPDMILADDVRDRTGRLLMSSGTVLTPKYIKICKIWGVVEADISGISSEDMETSAMKRFDASTIAAAEEAVRKRFSHSDMDHPAVREFFRLCTLRTAEGRYPDQDDVKQELPSQTLTPDIRKKKPSDIGPIKFIKEDSKLSTLPNIFRLIVEAISKPNSSAHDIANVIGKDPSLSARLLKIVNSAFYGYPSRIDTLSRAVNIVGTKQLSTLAIGTNVIHMFKNIPSKIINMKLFWKHSILCGINARVIAGYKNIQNTERMFVAGLLHDIGRLLLYNYAPSQSFYAIILARDNQDLLYRVEREILNCDHADVGGDLLKKWKLPVSLEDAVRHHHNPQKSQNRIEAAIIHLADIMANVMGTGSSGEMLIPPMDHDAWAQIGLSPNIIPLTMEQSERQLEEIFEFFFNNEKQPEKKR